MIFGHKKRQRTPGDEADVGFSRRVAVSVGLISLLVFGIGGWAAVSKLQGAVIAPGNVVVESNSKKVQHPTGGVVGAIHVKSGQWVDAGEVVIRLDDTQTRANLGVLTSQLTELMGRKARLIAERDGLAEIVFPDAFGSSHPDAEHVAEGERRLLEARRKSADSQKAQLKERIGQFNSEIEGLKRQEMAKSRELELIKDELDRVERMFKQQLTPYTRVLAMQRDWARVEGEHGALLSQIARAGGQISEIELKIIEIDDTIRTEAQKELRDLEARIAELSERRIAAEDMLKRIDIRAPQSGIVHALSVHTVGGVIGPGETVMEIVPIEDQKVIEVRLAPTDIDQVTIGQSAILRFPAFNQRTTPELKGSVSRVDPDLTREKETGMAYYLARISVDEEDISKFKSMPLVAGMPVEGFIQTGERTALSYLVKPFSDQVARVFREE
jgi:HlyD family secretion protein